MDRKKFNSLLQRYSNDQCTETERSYVESWFDATQKEARDVDSFQQELLRDKLWNEIESRMEEKEFRSINFRSINYWAVGKMAAALLLISAVVFSFSYYFQSVSNSQTATTLPSGVAMVTVSNQTNTIREVSLKDGSKVLVQPGSELVYPVTFGSLREVYLTGEAFFEVKKDPSHPFLVHAGEVTTRVLGTSFMVKAYENQKDIKVSVTSGRVSVISKTGHSFFNLWPGKEEVILTPNQQVIYNRKKKTAQKQLVENPRMLLPDASRELVYTNEPVIKLFNALEKIYGVTIQYNEKLLANCTITTEMTDEGLFERMDVICHVLNARYSVSDTEIVIESTGCSN